MGARWYDRDGKLVTEVPKKDGKGMKSVTVREARQLDLIPSVTTVTKIIANEGLTKWMVGRALEGFDPYAEGGEAADFGTIVHDCIETFLTSKVKTQLSGDEAEFNKFLDPVYDYVDGMDGVCERRLVDDDTAGTMDFFGATNENFITPMAYVDWKTQKTEQGKAPRYYDTWVMQLAQYRKMYGDPNVPLVNVVISSTEVGRIEHKVWKETDAAWGLKAFQAFLGAFKIYKKLEV